MYDVLGFVRLLLLIPILAATLIGQSTVGEQHAAALKKLRAEFEARLQAIEAKQAAAVPGGPGTQDIVRRGIGRLGQTTIFDSTFNPAISLSADFALVGTNQSDRFESANGFSLRSLELGIVGRVDPYMSYQAIIHFDEEEVEVEEAYALLDDALPGTFMLKFGRFNMDFGKISPVHDHDLDFLDKPQVLQEYLGGALRGTGAELHHWVPVGESHLVRWMAGITNGLDGDSHASFGPAAGHEHEHDEEGAEPFGDREFENFALHGRLSTLLELGETSTLQVGTSGAWAPEERQFYETDAGDPASINLERLILGADVTFQQVDPATGAGTKIGSEVMFSRREMMAEMGGRDKVKSLGAYAFAQRSFNPNWTLGVSGGWFEHAEDDSERSWDLGSYLTWNVNEFSRLRLELRHFDDPGEDTWGATLQWTTILGSHGHGIDW